eukprot:326258-Rhodomonas_salina.1
MPTRSMQSAADNRLFSSSLHPSPPSSLSVLTDDLTGFSLPVPHSAAQTALCQYRTLLLRCSDCSMSVPHIATALLKVRCVSTAHCCPACSTSVSSTLRGRGGGR